MIITFLSIIILCQNLTQALSKSLTPQYKKNVELLKNW
jgi:hypothetical protein